MGGNESDSTGQAAIAADPADPFDLPIAPLPIPRIDPVTPARERRILVDELRGLVDRGEYQIAPDIVALAVMNTDGRFIQHDTAE